MKTINGLYYSELNSSRACAFCTHHSCSMTVKQMRCKNCLGKQCRHFIKNESHPFWRQRELVKQKKKSKKQMFNDYIMSFNGGA